MAHQLFFRVAISISRFLPDGFCTDERFTCSATKSDQNGFLIWKLFTSRDNAAAVYQHLLAEPELTQVSFAFATEGFAFVFFDSRK
jgi:uncharacterized protein YbaA (DUF1428 family)